MASRSGFGTPSVASLVDVVKASELFDDSYTLRPESGALVRILAGQVASRLGFGTPSVASLVDVVQASELFDDSYTLRPENGALV